MNSKLSHSDGGEAWQIAMFRLGAHAPAVAGCPVERERTRQVETAPHDAAQERKEPGEGMPPAMEQRLEAQRHVEPERQPDLPAQSVGAVADKVAQLQGLLDLLEEDFDLPAAAVEIGHGRRRPREIVGEKLQHRHHAVEFDHGSHAAQAVGILAARERMDQPHLVVVQDMPRGPVQASFPRETAGCSWCG